MLRRIIGTESDEVTGGLRRWYNEDQNIFISQVFPQRLHVLNIHTFDPVHSMKKILSSY